jgi:hypothetical protein
VRNPRIVVVNHVVAGHQDAGALRNLQSAGLIQLRYRDDPRLEDCEPGSPSWQEYDKSGKLDWASFSVDGRTIAEIPSSP